MREDRRWMYNRLNANGRLLPEFIKGVKEFVKVACSNFSVVTIINDKQCIACSCKKWENLYTKDLQIMRIYLYQFRFRKRYENWHIHGEQRPNSSLNVSQHPPTEPNNDNYHVRADMVRAATGQNFDWEEDRPTEMAKKFFDILAASETPLWKENMMNQLS